MGVINIPVTFSADTTISSSDVNLNFSTIYSEFNGNIAAANLAASAVTTSKIADANVTTAKLADGNVTTAKLANGAVTNAKLDTGAGGIGTAWQSYVPTLTNITLGNGTLACSYIQIGKTIHFKFQLTFGSTSAMGSNSTIALPVTSISYITNTPLGVVNAVVSGSNYAGTFGAASTTTGSLLFLNAAGTYTVGTLPTSSVPNTWGTGSLLSIMGTYEAA